MGQKEERWRARQKVRDRRRTEGGGVQSTVEPVGKVWVPGCAAKGTERRKGERYEGEITVVRRAHKAPKEGEEEIAARTQKERPQEGGEGTAQRGRRRGNSGGVGGGCNAEDAEGGLGTNTSA